MRPCRRLSEPPCRSFPSLRVFCLLLSLRTQPIDADTAIFRGNAADDARRSRRISLLSCSRNSEPSRPPHSSDDYAYRQVAHLTENIGPRPSGSLQAKAAVDYVAAELRQLGLDVQLEEVKVPHWVRGAETAELVEYRGPGVRARRRRLCSPRWAEAPRLLRTDSPPTSSWSTTSTN